MEIEVSVFMAILNYFKKDKGWTKRVGKNQFIRESTLMGPVYFNVYGQFLKF
ncbi:MAG: hypothetical protein PUK14_05715 [Clostridiales bacterium]|nr:hypothetical protein [Clostridiales bacterium]